MPFAERGLEPDRDGFLADVEVAEAADQAQAIKLAGLFLEPADQHHLFVEVQQFVVARLEAAVVGVGLLQAAQRERGLVERFIRRRSDHRLRGGAAWPWRRGGALLRFGDGSGRFGGAGPGGLGQVDDPFLAASASIVRSLACV
jgi:hypothetical protein